MKNNPAKFPAKSNQESSFGWILWLLLPYQILLVVPFRYWPSLACHAIHVLGWVSMMGLDSWLQNFSGIMPFIYITKVTGKFVVSQAPQSSSLSEIHHQSWKSGASTTPRAPGVSWWLVASSQGRSGCNPYIPVADTSSHCWDLTAGHGVGGCKSLNLMIRNLGFEPADISLQCKILHIGKATLCPPVVPDSDPPDPAMQGIPILLGQYLDAVLIQRLVCRWK